MHTSESSREATYGDFGWDVGENLEVEAGLDVLTQEEDAELSSRWQEDIGGYDEPESRWTEIVTASDC